MLIPRSATSSVRCTTLHAEFNTAATTDGYFGKDGLGSVGCPDGLAAVGKLCFAFPMMNKDYFTTTQTNCDGDKELYAPNDEVQNAVVR